MHSELIDQKPGKHPKFEQGKLSEWKGHSRNNSWNPGASSVQLWESHSRPKSSENQFSEHSEKPHKGFHFSPNSLSFLLKAGGVPARQNLCKVWEGVGRLGEG